MTQNQQPMKVKTTTGTTVEISLEEWIKTIIDSSLAAHKVECPLNSHIAKAEKEKKEENLHERMTRLEWKMALVQWVGGSIGLASIAHIVSTVFRFVARA